MKIETSITYDLSAEEINSIIVIKTLLLELQEYHIDAFLGYDSDRFLNILQEILNNNGKEIE